MIEYGICDFCKESDAVYDMEGYGACMDCFSDKADVDREKMDKEEDLFNTISDYKKTYKEWERKDRMNGGLFSIDPTEFINSLLVSKKREEIIHYLKNRISYMKW